jgi:hypothetical protein
MTLPVFEPKDVILLSLLALALLAIQLLGVA